MNSDGIYYPFEVLIAFNRKAIKLQSVINYITIHCHNTSKGIRIKILVTSNGNIRNQLVYVANHNKTLYLLGLIGLKVHWILKTMECHHIY